MTMKLLTRIGLLLFAGLLGAQPTMADRIKDLASVAGVRHNQLTGSSWAYPGPATRRRRRRSPCRASRTC